MSKWKEVKLGEIVQFQRGFDLLSKDRTHGNIPVISSSGITGYHNTAKAKSPGVIIGRKGTLGTVHYINCDYWPHDTTLWAKDFKKNQPRFIYYFLKLMHFENYDVGASNPTLNRNHIHKLKLSFPPLPIQKKIAAILSTYDDLIENNDRRITLLEKMAEEIYREWFVRHRFPGHEQVTFHKGIPEGWETQTLQNIAQINARSISKGKEPKTIGYVDIASVTTNQINKIDEINFKDAPGRARRIVKHGDIIWSTVRPANRAYCLILDPPENLIVSTGFVVISANNDLPYSFLCWAVTSNAFVEHIASVAKGSAYPAAGKEDFEKSEILVPSKEILNKFHALCELMLKQKKLLAEKNNLLKQTRDRLLTRLISGKLSVEDLNIQYPPSMTEAVDTERQ